MIQRFFIGVLLSRNKILDVLNHLAQDTTSECVLAQESPPKIIQRLALGVEYLGSNYHGWQVQTNVDNVQARVQHALSRIANHQVDVVCAGRTDRGVHATLQVVHFDTPAERNDQAWLRGAMSGLPHDIGVLWVRRVSADFHARFSAVRRSYSYVLFNASHRPGLLHGRVSWFYRPLDVALMQQAAIVLLGTHDFSSFRGSECQAHSPVRTLFELNIQRDGDFIYFDLTANAFLMHMVRNIVGTLMQVGTGQRPAEWVAIVLAARRREMAGITAPPDGLYLTHVEYPEVFTLNQAPRCPKF